VLVATVIILCKTRKLEICRHFHDLSEYQISRIVLPVSVMVSEKKLYSVTILCYHFQFSIKLTMQTFERSVT